MPDILAPKLRTVPSHLYSPKEKADLARIVNVMLEFGLSFVQEKSFQGGYVYNLDPYVVIIIIINKYRIFLFRTAHKWHISFSNILEVGVFPNCTVHRNLAYAVQQIIAQELEVERLKRASISMRLGASSENVTNTEKPEVIKSAQDRSSNNRNNTKQSEKTVAPLKEVVSVIRFSSYRPSNNLTLFTLNNFRCIEIFSEMSLRMNIKVLRSKVKRVVYPRSHRRNIL